MYINAKLLHFFQEGMFNVDKVKDLFESAAFWHVEPDKEGLEFALRERIEKLAENASDNAGDLLSLRNLAAAVSLTPKLPFTVNFYQTQNIFYELLKNGYPKLKTAAAKGDKNAAIWVEEFRDLAANLSIKVD